jgi:hypothetical protein
VSVTFVSEKAMSMRRAATCGLSDLTIFFNIASEKIRFSTKRKTNKVIEHKMCV